MGQHFETDLGQLVRFFLLGGVNGEYTPLQLGNDRTVVPISVFLGLLPKLDTATNNFYCANLQTDKYKGTITPEEWMSLGVNPNKPDVLSQARAISKGPYGPGRVVGHDHYLAADYKPYILRARTVIPHNEVQDLPHNPAVPSATEEGQFLAHLTAYIPPASVLKLFLDPRATSDFVNGLLKY